MATLQHIFKKETLIQMVKYGLIGCVAFAVDYGTLLVLTQYCHVYYLLSNVFSFCLGVIVSYIGSIGWVFHQEQTKSRTRDIVVFLIIGVIGLVFTELLLYIFTEWAHVYYLISKIIATIIVFFWNFFARKVFVVKINQYDQRHQS